MTQPPRTLRTEFVGYWCDHCRVASPVRACPDCHRAGRPAKITVELTDVADEEWPR